MKRKTLLYFVVVFCVFSLITTTNADPIKFARFPHISHGKIVFTYHGDIWLANDNGSNPIQLTDHIARDENPRFSPDGKWIAFTSNRMGNNDIWVMPSTGGEPRQVTFNTTNDNMLYWTPDGKRIIFSTSRGAMMWSNPLYTVSVNGDIPVPIEMGIGAAGMISLDGSMLAFNRVAYRHPKKNYRGSSAANIWVKDLNNNAFKKLTNIELEEYKTHTHDAYPMWGADGMIYFMSERSGIFNIWKISPRGGEPAQVTFHTRDGVQFPSISPDGKTIIYSNEFELWTLPLPDGQPIKITIDIPYRPENNLVQYLTTTNNADGFSPSPTGDYVAVDYHGEIFIVPAESGVGEMKQITSAEWREQTQSYSPDGRYLAYLSDESGDDEIWLYELATGDTRKLTAQESKKSVELWSSDSKQILFSANNTIYSVDAASGLTTEVAYNRAGGFSNVQFSPDGKWLVYSRSDDEQNYEVYLYDIAAKKEFNISQHLARDTGGFLSGDQKTLIFTSNRGTGVNQIYAVPLEKITVDVEDPLYKEQMKNEEPERPQRGEEGEEEAELDSITIDMDNIKRRAKQLTSGGSVGSVFLGSDGKTIYYTTGDGGGAGRGAPPPETQRPAGAGDGSGPALNSISIGGEDQKKVVDGSFSGLKVTQDRKTIFYRQQNGVYRMPLASRKKEQVMFNFTVFIDKKKEWKQMFDEFYRHWKYSYVEEDMLGFDWDAIRAKYEPFVEYIGETRDFYDLAAEMLFELNSTHSGASPPREEGTSVGQTYRTRLLGFEMAPDNGRYKVSHIYRDGPADKDWVDINEGDYVLAIDGQEIKPPENYWKVMNKKLNDYATVTLSASPGFDDNTRDVRIKTVTSNSGKYQEWVEKNREFVEDLTNGEIAYVHIRAMNQTCLEQFEQEIDQYFNRKGIIIDVRFNGGGNIDQQLMDILERKPYQYTWSKSSSPLWGRRPKQTIVGPKVMITNWRSNSDAEMTPHGFRHLGLGQLVGTPTNGAVVSARTYRLLDGGSTRIPGTRVVSFDPTKPDNFGFNLENYGVPPDVWVENTPEDNINGYDRVLKAAVDEVLRMLKEGNWQYDTKRNN